MARRTSQRENALDRIEAGIRAGGSEDGDLVPADPAGVATAEPGLVVHRNGNGLIIGEPDGTMSPLEARALSDRGVDGLSYDAATGIWTVSVPAPALVRPPAPPIDYLAKDYDSFRLQMIAAMSERVPP